MAKLTTRIAGMTAAVVLAALPLRAGAVGEGEAVAVIQQAQLTTRAGIAVLETGGLVAVGDVVQTGPTGEAQIIFPDDTRIVVGPSSALRIDRAIFRDNGTARRFAVTAAGGTFRFLSGRSNSNAYSITTPTATMGVRGTSFDFAVDDGTDLVVFTGGVRFCEGSLTSGRCARVDGGCLAVRLRGDGRFVQPETLEEKVGLLDSRFPYIAQQERLQPRFRTSSNGCRDNDRRIVLPPPPREARDDDDPPANPAE